MFQVFFRIYRRLGAHMQRRGSTVALFFAAMICYSTTGFMYFEVEQNPDLSWMDSFWWTIVTMTTVGYGDFFPVSPAGRLLVGLPTMLLGVAMLGYMLSWLAGVILENKLKEVKGMLSAEYTDHIVICHFNGVEKTLELVEEIRRDSSTQDTNIVLIDEYLSENPQELIDQKIHFVRGNPAKEVALERANTRRAKYVLVQADLAHAGESDNRNLVTALTVEKLYPDVHTVVHCLDPENIPFFERAGCDSVVCLSSLSNQLMVQELQDPGVHAVLADLTSNRAGDQFYIVEAPSDIKTYGELRGRVIGDHTLLIGLRHHGETSLLPDDSTKLAITDKVILIANTRPSFS